MASMFTSEFINWFLSTIDLRSQKHTTVLVMVHEMDVPSPTSMGEPVTKASYRFSKFQILFALVMTITLLILTLYIRHMEVCEPE